MLFGPEFTLLDGFLILGLVAGFFKLVGLIEYWCTPQKIPYTKNGMKFTIDKDTYQIERDPKEFWAMVDEYLEEHKDDIQKVQESIERRNV